MKVNYTIIAAVRTYDFVTYNKYGTILMISH